MESNSFVPGETSRADFERQMWSAGAPIQRDAAGPASELAGAWDALVERGMAPFGTIVAAASPGAPVAREVYDTVRAELLAGCSPDVQGVYLMFHGSALVTGIDDPEGMLLQAVREHLPSGVPIAISLDLHAYITDRMMANCDIVTAYRTCPHIDLYRTGYHAGELLARAVSGDVSPVCRRVKLPMITPPERHDSSQALFRDLQELCTAAEQEGALSAALLCTQPWLDVPELGWSVVVTTDDDPAAAHDVALGIADHAWRARQEFLNTSEVPVAEAVAFAMTQPGPFVVSDIGDATNGGSLGDSTEVLRVLLARQADGEPAGPAAVTVVDQAAAEAAYRAGEGVQVDLILGTGAARTFNEATQVSGTVRRLFDTTLTYTHPAAEGVTDNPGPSAIVDVGDIAIVVHSRAVRVIDPAIYIAAGIDLDSLQVVQAKSHVSYRAGFDPVTSGSVLADTKGPTAANLNFLPFTKQPRPLFPFDDCQWDPESVSHA